MNSGCRRAQDALHRLVDVWATGEASASLGFAAARAFDELDPLEREADKLLAAQGATSAKARAKAQREASERAADCSACLSSDPQRAQLESDPLLRFVLLDSLADVLCPATKLWNTGWGAQMMREAVSLMGGYGITEDCPGFPRQQVDGCATGSDLRRAGSGAAAATFHHHGQPAVPRAVQGVD